MHYTPICVTCGREFNADVLGCPCGGSIRYTYKGAFAPATGHNMWRYADRLPVRDRRNVVTLGEGSTPLTRSHGLFADIRLWLKDETQNPTGSMKDRAMSVAFSKAREMGFERSIIMSSGGAGIAAAAYAARARVRNLVLVPEDLPASRLLLPYLAGSLCFRVGGNMEDVLAIVDACRRSGLFYEVSTYRGGNPFQAEAPKTIAYEIVEELGHAPAQVIVPVGGGGTIASIYAGFADLKEAGRIGEVPRMIGVQNEKFNALRLALDEGLSSREDLLRLAERVDSAQPTATAGLRHAFPPDGVEALRAIRASGGHIVTVRDDEALDWQRRLVASEGLLAEPSSTTALAALARMEADGSVAQEGDVVVVVTGAGWRDLVHLNETTDVVVHELRPGDASVVDRLVDLTDRTAARRG